MDDNMIPQCLGGEGGQECMYTCDFGEPDCVDYVTRLKRYCHHSILTTSEGDEGSLGADRDTNGLELVHLHIMARHGDRTPVHSYSIDPLASSYQCGLVDDDPKWTGLTDFRTSSLNSQVLNSRVAVFPGRSSIGCAYGRLTLTGYKQEYALGSLMREKYPQLSGVDPREMFVQTTDYPRTLHSAASFLLGFLPNDFHIRRSTVIHISPDAFTDTPPIGIKRTYDYCKNFYQKIWPDDLRVTGYTTEVKEKFQHLVKRFCEMFNLKLSNQPVACELLDHLQVRGCHLPYDPLPCNERGECVDYTFAKQLAVAGDWTYEHKHPRNSSFLLLLPFLKHSIIDVMENVVHGEWPAYKVMLTFTHDDVIAKLRSILGIPTLEWVPYASRLVFELWRTRGSEPDYYVRMLFNGETITNTIRLPSERTSFEQRHNLILLQTLHDHILTDKLADVRTYHNLCLK